MSVMGALNNSIINRLKSAWNIIKNDILLIFDQLNEFISHFSNYKFYRQKISALISTNSFFLPIFCLFFIYLFLY